MTDITELAQSLKAAAEKAIGAHERLAAYPYDEIIDISQQEGEQIDIDITDINEFLEEASPANILALVEALETEKRICATWRKTAESTSEKLEKAQAAERRWHRVASRVHEQACESDVKIDELEAIRAAAEKLVRCKGRYHSEQNYRALAALFGVNIPDLPPLEHENVHYADAAEMEIEALRQRIAELESRTVKLPPKVDSSNVPFAGNAWNCCLDEVEKRITAAGIKVEVE
ncbi:TPA: ead/Ea22-like family protein [Klebsiella pneumoniae]|nr:ead/Ea22-like family protein [Klebsiella pneumoniae]